MPNRRIATLDAMTGIAMLLVVLAHHRFYFMPEWYERLYYCTYIFHMPLFITLSGFLIRYSYKGVIGWGGTENTCGESSQSSSLPTSS